MDAETLQTNAPEREGAGERVRPVAERLARHPWMVFALLALVFYAGNRHLHGISIDTASNNVSAEHVAETGSPCVDDPTLSALTTEKYYGQLLWMVESDRCVLSKYPPGTYLPFVPFYKAYQVFVQPFDDVVPADRLLDDELVPVRDTPRQPAFIGAALLMAFACFALFRAGVGFGVRREVALWGSVLFGVGTPMWTVVAGEMWPHTADILYLSLALWAASRQRWWLTGLPMGLAIMTRPHMVLIAAAIGLAAGWRERNVWPTIKVAAGSLLGSAALLAYNDHYFGKASISGGYGDNMTAKLAGSRGWVWFVQNVGMGLFHYKYGLLVVTPVVIVAVWLIILKRRQIDPVLLASAIGGALYLAIQWRMNRASGGEAYYTYRYPMELMVTLLIPVMIAYEKVTAEQKKHLLQFCAVGIGMQLLAVADILPAFFPQWPSGT